MAKVCMTEREQKRRETVKKYSAKRAELVEIINNQNASVEDRFAARSKLQSLPRNSSPVRTRNRCALTPTRWGVAGIPQARTEGVMAGKPVIRLSSFQLSGSDQESALTAQT